MNATQSFGEWLRHRRRELDLTQEALARQVGCARVTIRKLRSGRDAPFQTTGRITSSLSESKT